MGRELKFTCGKYKGRVKTLVQQEDPSYVTWYDQNVNAYSHVRTEKEKKQTYVRKHGEFKVDMNVTFSSGMYAGQTYEWVINHDRYYRGELQSPVSIKRWDAVKERMIANNTYLPDKECVCPFTGLKLEGCNRCSVAYYYVLSYRRMFNRYPTASSEEIKKEVLRESKLTWEDVQAGWDNRRK